MSWGDTGKRAAGPFGGVENGSRADEQVFSALGLVAILLTVVGVCTNLAYDVLEREPDRLQRFLDINGEGNLPTWYSVVLLAAAAAAVAAMAHERRLRGSADSSSWYVLASLVAFMSLDEMTTMHEESGALLDKQVDIPLLGKYAWIVPGTIAAAVVAVVMARALRSLSPPSRRSVIRAGALFVAAAIGIEVLEAILLNDDRNYLGRSMHLLTGTQELLEMLAVVLFLRAIWTELVRPLDAPPGQRGRQSGRQSG